MTKKNIKTNNTEAMQLSLEELEMVSAGINYATPDNGDPGNGGILR